MARRTPSMTALLGLLAIAGYQNRDKIGDLIGKAKDALSGAGQGGGAAPASELEVMFDEKSAGGTLSSGLNDVFETFNKSGHADTVGSWVGKGQNRPLDPRALQAAVGDDTLDELSAKLGLSRPISWPGCPRRCPRPSMPSPRKAGCLTRPRRRVFAKPWLRENGAGTNCRPATPTPPPASTARRSVGKRRTRERCVPAMAVAQVGRSGERQGLNLPPAGVRLSRQSRPAPAPATGPPAWRNRPIAGSRRLPRR
ncbi:MAG: YidB family protein [Burkholderiaceae bacterium]